MPARPVRSCAKRPLAWSSFTFLTNPVLHRHFNIGSALFTECAPPSVMMGFTSIPACFIGMRTDAILFFAARRFGQNPIGICASVVQIWCH